MKRFTFFIISFALLFIVLQTVSGMILTSMYTPNVEGAWSQAAALPQETVAYGSTLPSLLIVLIGLFSAAVAYSIQMKFFNRSHVTTQ